MAFKIECMGNSQQIFNHLIIGELPKPFARARKCNIIGFFDCAQIVPDCAQMCPNLESPGKQWRGALLILLPMRGKVWKAQDNTR